MNISPTDMILVLGFLVTNVMLLLTRGPKGVKGDVGPMGMTGERGLPCDCC